MNIAPDKFKSPETGGGAERGDSLFFSEHAKSC